MCIAHEEGRGIDDRRCIIAINISETPDYGPREGLRNCLAFILVIAASTVLEIVFDQHDLRPAAYEPNDLR